MKYWLLLLFIIAPVWADANAEPILNVYNWSGYISNDVLKEFEKETGIHVNYTTYDSNETMYAKLKADPDAGYDIVVPSTYFIDRMYKQGMLRKIDKNKIPNFKNLNPALLNKPFDPHNQYSIPYFWSTTGIAINTKYYPYNSITSWNDLWKSEYKDQLLLLDDVREVFSMALISLGYSANDADPEHIKQAYLKLRQLLPNVRLFNDEAAASIYIDEDAVLGMGWDGDIYMANKENPDVQFIYPKEGYVLSLDSMAIPSGARHVDNAYKFINFILRPDIAMQISMATGYASPNLAAQKLMPKELATNKITYPDAATLARGQVQTDVGSQANAVYQRYWELLKIGA